MIKYCELLIAVTCKENDNIVGIAKKMRDKEIRHIYVIDDNESPLGIISTTDITNRVVAEGRDINLTIAKEIMTSPIKSINENEDVKSAYGYMGQNNHFAILVVDDKNQIKGVLTFNEAFKKLSSKMMNKQAEIGKTIEESLGE